MVELWDIYGIEMLRHTFEHFYATTSKVSFEEQFRIAFAFNIPDMKVAIFLWYKFNFQFMFLY